MPLASTFGQSELGLVHKGKKQGTAMEFSSFLKGFWQSKFFLPEAEVNKQHSLDYFSNKLFFPSIDYFWKVRLTHRSAIF